MKAKFIFLFLCLALLGGVLPAQNADISLNSRLYHFLDRVDILGLADTIVHTDVKPYGRESFAAILSRVDSSQLLPQEQNWLERMRLLADDEYATQTPGKGIFKHFFRNGRDLYYYRNEEISLFVNPLLGLAAGGELFSHPDSANREFLFLSRNTRGARLRGSVMNKLGFFAEVTENQIRYPDFVRQSYNQYDVLWSEGFMKTIGANGFDFFNARGYLTYSPFKFMRLKFGRDKAFWGNGYQSLLLSDYAVEHNFLSINTRFWQLEYVNHFAQMIDFIPNKPDAFGSQPKKFAAFHMLSWKPSDKFSIGLFESVVYSPTLPGGVRGFELDYLNPLIFYRSAEQFLGSPDNSFLGLMWKYNFMKKFQFYGQLLVDDFNWRNRVNGTGFYGNKYGYQLGLKYINVAGISGLDAQVEYNRIRPFTYQHFNPSANFTHYGQFLGHSMGANLWDANVILRYQPTGALYGEAIFTVLQQGVDFDGTNFGGDPFRSYISRPSDYGNTLGQGQAFNLLHLQGKIGYQLMKLNAFAEIEGRFRQTDTQRSLSVLGSIRWNLPAKKINF